MKLSIVTTLFRSAPYIKEFYARASHSAKKLVGEDYEIVFVNDGSPDDSYNLVAELVKSDSHLTQIDLSRNFGHHKAMMTGLQYSMGETVFLIDSDLEEEPEWLESFSIQMEDSKSDVIYGVQKQRKGGIFEQFSGSIFYLLFNYMTEMDLPKNIVTARLMSRRYVNALLGHNERELMIAGLWHVTGFKQTPVFINKHGSSDTTYTIRKKISILINSITSFSNKPLYLIFYAGVFIFFAAILYILHLIYKYLFLSLPPEGWISVMASIWLLGGIIISFIGVVAIYLSKIFIEVKQRPYTIVREILRQQKKSSEVLQ